MTGAEQPGLRPPSVERPSVRRPPVPAGPGDAIAVDAAPPTQDARAVIDELNRRLMVERETSLNSVDAVLGARAKEAQARAENKELLYRLHVREAELAQLKELMVEAEEAPDPAVERSEPTDDPSEHSVPSGEPGQPPAELPRAAKELFRAAAARVRRR